MSLLIILVALLPGFAWLFFYLQEDLHPEPKGLLATAFMSGAAFSFLALAVQLILKRTGYIPEMIRPDAVAAFLPYGVIGAIFAFSFVEEIFKFAAAYLTVHNKPDFDEPVDAMIYAVVAALGFATVENLGAIAPAPGQPAMLGLALETVSMRFMGATLLHTLAASLVGYYWALSIRGFGRNAWLWFGILLATLLHGTFNYLIINYGSLVYGLIFIAVAGLFVLLDFEKLKNKPV